MDNEIKELAYLIMQHKYLEMYGADKMSEKEILKNSYKYFPQYWFSLYSLDQKIELISYALKNKISLIEAIDKKNTNTL